MNLQIGLRERLRLVLASRFCQPLSGRVEHARMPAMQPTSGSNMMSPLTAGDHDQLHTVLVNSISLGRPIRWGGYLGPALSSQALNLSCRFSGERGRSKLSLRHLLLLHSLVPDQGRTTPFLARPTKKARTCLCRPSHDHQPSVVESPAGCKPDLARLFRGMGTPRTLTDSATSEYPLLAYSVQH